MCIERAESWRRWQAEYFCTATVTIGSLLRLERRHNTARHPAQRSAAWSVILQTKPLSRPVIINKQTCKTHGL